MCRGVDVRMEVLWRTGYISQKVTYLDPCDHFPTILEVRAGRRRSKRDRQNPRDRRGVGAQKAWTPREPPEYPVLTSQDPETQWLSRLNLTVRQAERDGFSRFVKRETACRGSEDVTTEFVSSCFETSVGRKGERERQKRGGVSREKLRR